MGYADRDYYRDERPRAAAAPLAPARLAPLLAFASLLALAADRLADEPGWLHRAWSLRFRSAGFAEGWHRWFTHPFADGSPLTVGLAVGMAWIAGRSLERRFGLRWTALVGLAGAATAALAYAVLRSGGPGEPLAGLLPVGFAWCFHAARWLPRHEVGVYVPLRIEVPLRFFAWTSCGLALLCLLSEQHSLTAVAALAGGLAGSAFFGPPRAANPPEAPVRRRRRRRRKEPSDAPAPRPAQAPRSAADAQLDRELDRLLAKISAEGLPSLTPAERQTLDRASQAKREALGR